MQELINVLVGSAVLCGIYTLVSVGFVYIYRSTGLINFAHGEFLLLGAWFAYSVSRQGSLPPAGAVVVAMIITGVVAAFVYRVAVSRAATHGLFVGVLATMGLATVLDGATPLIWGTSTQSLPIVSNATYSLFDHASITAADVFVIGFALVIYLLVLLIDKKTVLGVQMRAAASSQLLASNTGLRVSFLFMLAWLISGALAAAAGIAYATSNLLSSDLVSVGLAGLPAVLLGGFDSVAGALPGAAIVALVVTAVSAYWTSNAALAVAYAILLVIVMIRPRGLLGSTAVERL